MPYRTPMRGRNFILVWDVQSGTFDEYVSIIKNASPACHPSLADPVGRFANGDPERAPLRPDEPAYLADYQA